MRSAFSCLLLAACVTPFGESADEVARAQRIVVDLSPARSTVGPALLGANINTWYADAGGVWDRAAQAPNADVVAKTAQARLGLLRFPGGTSASLYDWKRGIGPRGQRACQMEAHDLHARHDNDYGPAEFGEVLEQTGADGQVMVPFMRITPQDAADWVEYMNGPADDAHPWAKRRGGAPFRVTRWELGNEPDRSVEGYWMAPDADQRRLGQYIAGYDHDFTDQPLARDCEIDDTTTTDAANQTFYFRWGLASAPSVKVGGTPWTRVESFAGAGATARVYTFDAGRSAIQFGDGVHGAVPPAGRQVTASYHFHNAGFVAIYDAMKAKARELGVPIDVCAAWAPPDKRGATTLGEPSFAGEMASRGLAAHYDCVVMHPYTSFGRDFGEVWNRPGEAHDEMMLGDGWAKRMVGSLVDDVTAHGKPGPDGTSPYVAISEFGALWFDGGDKESQSLANAPTAGYGMSHALYMASQWLHDARFRLGWVEGNTLIAAGSLRGTLGGKSSGFVYGAEAMTREVLGDVFASGARWVGSDVENAQEVTAIGAVKDPYQVLLTGATVGADGVLRIAVVNRARVAASTATIAAGPHARRIAVTTVRGRSAHSAIDGDGPGDDSVAITHTTVTVGTESFAYEFPPASLTVLAVQPR